MFFYFLVLFYFITFTRKRFVLAMAAVNAKLRAILLYKILQFLCRFINSAHDGYFCARWPILCKILQVQNSDISTIRLHSAVE